MSAQTTYNYATPVGIPGGIVDLAPYAIDTFINEETTGKMKFGLGVVQGTSAGTQVKLPTDAQGKFEGVTVNNRTTEYDLDGNIRIREGVGMGVMRYGRIYVRLAAGAAPKYGDAAYVIATGDEAGCFTQDKGSNIAVAGRFLSDAKNGLAAVELFNAPAPAVDP